MSSDERCQICKGTVCEYRVYSQPESQGVCRTAAKAIEDCYAYTTKGTCLQCEFGNCQNPKGECRKLSGTSADHCAFSQTSVSSCSRYKNSPLTLNDKCPSRRKCADRNCDKCFGWA